MLLFHPVTMANRCFTPDGIYCNDKLEKLRKCATADVLTRAAINGEVYKPRPFVDHFMPVTKDDRIREMVHNLHTELCPNGTSQYFKSTNFWHDMYCIDASRRIEFSVVPPSDAEAVAIEAPKGTMAMDVRHLEGLDFREPKEAEAKLQAFYRSAISCERLKALMEANPEDASYPYYRCVARDMVPSNRYKACWKRIATLSYDSADDKHEERKRSLLQKTRNQLRNFLFHGKNDTVQPFRDTDNVAICDHDDKNKVELYALLDNSKGWQENNGIALKRPFQNCKTVSQFMGMNHSGNAMYTNGSAFDQGRKVASSTTVVNILPSQRRKVVPTKNASEVSNPTSRAGRYKVTPTSPNSKGPDAKWAADVPPNRGGYVRSNSGSSTSSGHHHPSR